MVSLERHDMQGLIVSAYSNLPCAAYALFRITNRAAARGWLGALAGEVTTAEGKQPVSSLNVAFTYSGLAQLGLDADGLASFSNPFRDGMASERRSRILGDTAADSPIGWDWGGTQTEVHALLLIYGVDERTLEDQLNRRLGEAGAAGLQEVAVLVAGRQPDSREHFGFADGIGQPVIEGTGNEERQLGRTGHATVVKAGEFILGYVNEYNGPAPSPSVAATRDLRGMLAAGSASDDGGARHDLGRNGSYLVFRQIAQHVAEFWRFVEEAAQTADGRSEPAAQERLAAKFVGRWPSGAPLVKYPHADPMAGTPELTTENDFEFHEKDPHGFACPIGAHIRRANPRDSLGTDPKSALESVRRHRILRRGRSYGDRLKDRMVEDGAPRGLHFICLNSDLERQFEFVQQTWINNRVFAGLYKESDPLIGNQDRTDKLMTVEGDPLRTRVHGLRRFVTIKGGAYFFLPPLRALRYLASIED